MIATPAPAGGPALTVSDLLERRLARAPRVLATAAAGAVLAHAGFLLFLALVTKPRPAAVVPPSVRVGVISPSALRRREPPAAASPVEKARPRIEKPDDTPKPSEKALPVPQPKKPEKAKPAPVAKPEAVPAEKPQAGPAVELPAAGGSAEPSTTAAFGASVSALDADFPFAYWLDQLLSLVGAGWLKPNVADGTFATVFFRVQKNGTLTDVKVEKTSGLAFYDRAATRAVFSANPLPPLPPEFKGDSLGVHLEFR